MNNLGKKLSVLGMASVLLSGCNWLTGFEKDLTVILNVSGEVYGTCVVNSFNNYYIKDDFVAPDPGDIFWGWSPKEDYIPEVDDPSLLLVNKKVIRYADVCKWALPDTDNIDLFAIFAPKPVYDLVVAWYNKPATSGCTEEIMGRYTDGLYDYLTTQSYTPASMKIDIRGYEGDVATVGSKVNADDDVDIIIGMGNNITTQGGIETLDRFDNVTIGAKTGRNICRLSDSELSILVFEWMKTEPALGLLL